MSKKIRVLALGLIQDGARLFLSQGYDSAKQETFYRALGGGIDFGEQSRQALEREFMEEIQATLTNIQYLGCLESIFVHQDKPGHEIIQLYKCDFADPKFYQIEQLTFKEGKREKVALWVPLEQVLSGELILYPENFLDYCKKLE
ncbi:MAG: NUDIX hydrolase [Cyanobacteriota bacterium]|nr:NUDIX hydrolase [Cyanobacteriota bacterium]